MDAIAVELGTGYVSIVPSARGFGAALSREIDGPVDRAARDSGDRGGRTFVSRFTSGFGGIATALAGAFVATQGVRFIGDSISAASDLEETVSRANTVFGESAGEIDAWSRTSAGAFGQSRQQALDAAGTFGNLFSQLGIGSGVTADMSTSLVELASDFASFHNANPEEVIQAQTAAFRGEYDALQRFVPTINAAAVQQRAMADTGKTNAAALTEQEKAAATYALMMEGAGDAVGDFDRTSDGLANQQRILSARFEDVKAKIGSALLPVMTRVVSFVSSRMIPAFEAVGRFIGDIPIEILAGLATVIGGALVGAFAAWAVSAGAAAAATLVAAAPVLAMGAAIAALVAGVIYAYQNFDTFRAVVDTVIRAVRDTFQSFVDYVREIWPQIQEAIGHVIATVQTIITTFISIVQAAWKLFGDEILEIARTIWDQIKVVVETAIGLVQGIIAFVLAIINGDWGKAWDAIKEIASTVWDGIRETVENAIGLVREAIEIALGAIDAIWDTTWETLKGIVTGAWDRIKEAVLLGIASVVEFVTGLPNAIVGAIGDLGRLLFNKGRDLIQGFIDGIESMMDALQRSLDRLPGGGAGGIGGDLFGSITGNATGGLLGTGQASWVGEAGRELVVPLGPSLVVPNHKLMGGSGGREEVRLLEVIASLLASIDAKSDSGGGGFAGIDGRARSALMRAGIG